MAIFRRRKVDTYVGGSPLSGGTYVGQTSGTGKEIQIGSPTAPPSTNMSPANIGVVVKTIEGTSGGRGGGGGGGSSGGGGGTAPTPAEQSANMSIAQQAQSEATPAQQNLSVTQRAVQKFNEVIAGRNNNLLLQNKPQYKFRSTGKTGEIIEEFNVKGNQEEKVGTRFYLGDKEVGRTGGEIRGKSGLTPQEYSDQQEKKVANYKQLSENAREEGLQREFSDYNVKKTSEGYEISGSQFKYESGGETIVFKPNQSPLTYEEIYTSAIQEPIESTQVQQKTELAGGVVSPKLVTEVRTIVEEHNESIKEMGMHNEVAKEVYIEYGGIEKQTNLAPTSSLSLEYLKSVNPKRPIEKFVKKTALEFYQSTKNVVLGTRFIRSYGVALQGSSIGEFTNKIFKTNLNYSQPTIRDYFSVGGAIVSPLLKGAIGAGVGLGYGLFGVYQLAKNSEIYKENPTEAAILTGITLLNLYTPIKFGKEPILVYKQPPRNTKLYLEEVQVNIRREEQMATIGTFVLKGNKAARYAFYAPRYEVVFNKFLGITSDYIIDKNKNRQLIFKEIGRAHV